MLERKSAISLKNRRENYGFLTSFPKGTGGEKIKGDIIRDFLEESPLENRNRMSKYEAHPRVSRSRRVGQKRLSIRVHREKQNERASLRDETNPALPLKAEGGREGLIDRGCPAKNEYREKYCF